MLSQLPNLARLWLWSMVIFVLTLWLGTRHNDFPWYYHPDEPGKVEQVLGTRPLNFHHPMLLLNSTKVAVSLLGVEKNQQSVVETGRRVSAFFTAAAVVALSLLGYVWRGWRVALISGLTLATHHQLYELSHYMKEDTALLFGLAVTFLAVHLHQRKPTLRTALFIGLGVGLAISGKALGLMALVVAVPVFIATRSQCGWRIVIASAVFAIAIIVAINPQAVLSMDAVRESSSREMELATGGQGMTQSVPHGKYWSVFLSNTTPIMWPLILAVIVITWKRRKEHNTAELATIGFPFALGIALSFFPKENDRYFLPATALFSLLAAMGAAELARVLHKKASRGLLEAGIGTALVLGQFINWTDDRGGLIRYDEAFQTDDTTELLVWLNQHSQAGEMIAKDNRVRLPDSRRRSRKARPLPNKVLSAEYAADLGTLDKLRADGVNIVIISESTFMRFERPGMRPKEGDGGDAERRRAFYAELRRSYEPAWSRQRSTVIYLHPGIEVYRIVQPN